MPPILKKSCGTQGCKASAMAGSIFCHAHNPNSIKSGGAPAGNHNAATPGSLYSKYMSADELLVVEQLADGQGLENEIKVARAMVIRLLGKDDPVAVGAALKTVAALISAHRKATGDQATGIVAAVATILEELNIDKGLFENG